MALKDRMNCGDETRDVTRMQPGHVKCPWCGRWNDVGHIDWDVEYLGRGKYRMCSLTYCRYCENEMYVSMMFRNPELEVE